MWDFADVSNTLITTDVMWDFVPIDPMNVHTKFEVRSFTRSWDKSNWSFGWGLGTPNLGEQELVVSYGVGNGTVRKSVGEFLLALHSNFSSIFTRFRNITAFVLQHATFSHPTSSLPNSPCSPGNSWMAFGLRRVKMSYQCKIRLRLLWRPNRKSHTRFRLVPKVNDPWMTLNGVSRDCTFDKRLLPLHPWPV